MGVIRNIGVWLASIKGWWLVVGTLPSVVAAISGYFEGLPWAAIIVYWTAALAVGMALVLLSLLTFERATTFYTTRKEQTRIMTALENLGESITELDLPTAAAIWAGTAEIGNIERHTYFRGLKNAVDMGKIKASNFNKAGKANRNTTVDFEALKEFWHKKRVIR